MEQTIIRHMETVRGITEQAMKGFVQEVLDIIPHGFNNTIRWNFGHIAFVQEKLVFGILGEEMSTPKEYEQLLCRNETGRMDRNTAIFYRDCQDLD